MAMMLAKGGKNRLSFSLVEFGEGGVVLFRRLFGYSILNLLGKMLHPDRFAATQNKPILDDVFPAPGCFLENRSASRDLTRSWIFL